MRCHFNFPRTCTCIPLFSKGERYWRDLRRNLITLPSCDLHNSCKSKDDEYLRTIILMTAGNNAVGQHQLFGKLLPAVARRPHAYRAFISDKGTVARGKGRALQIDRKRFNRCIDHLVRAIFFDTYKHKWLFPIVSVSPNFFSGTSSDQMVPHQPSLKAMEASRQFLAKEPNRGEKSEVFMCRVRWDEANKQYAFAAIFYGCFEVYSFSTMHMLSTTA